MKIMILAAMSKELDLLKGLLDHFHEIRTVDDLPVYTGKIGDHDIVALQCGIGKVNSAIMTNDLITYYKPDLVINTGVAGGAGRTAVGDIIVAESVAYHDVWCGPGTIWGQAYGMPEVFKPSDRVVSVARQVLASQPGVHYGLICSGDIFVSKAQEVERIKSAFPEVLAIDMESAAIAHVCTRRGVDYAIIRAVSDTPGQGDNISQYEGFWEKAPQTTFAVLKEIIRNLD